MDDSAAVAALTAKYGAPTKDTETPAVTRHHGTPYISRIAVWDSFDNGRVVQYLGQGDSYVSIYFPENMTASELSKETQTIGFGEH
jgi:hypothetical protein